MLEGTLSVYAFIVIFPLAVIGGLLFLIRNYIRSTEYCDADARFDGKTIIVTATLEPQDKTSDDLDKMIGVNYIGHFLLTNLLCDKMLKHGNASCPGRIVNVVCGSLRSGHILSMDEMEGKFEGSYNMRDVYRSSKLALHLMTKELAHKYMSCGSSGLGRTLAAELCKRGARVIVACRTKARRDSTAYFLRSKTGSFNLRTMFMDLNSLDSVFDFCQDLVDTEERIDAIVNNAATLEPQDKTSDDLDKMIGVNYIGHFLLTNLLCDKMLKHGNASCPGRIVNVVCGSLRSGHILSMDEMEGKFEGSYNMRDVYRSSKLALHLMTKELAHKYIEEGVVSYSVDPGYVNTGLYRHLEGPFGKFNQTCARALYRTTEEAIQTILFCLSSKDVLKLSGSLFKDCRLFDVRNSAWTENCIKDLWTRASDLILSKGIKLELGAADEEEEAEKADSEQQDSEQ